MPLYEYKCSACDHPFEELVRGDETVSCPDCDSADVVKQLSAFAVSSSSALPDVCEGPGGCGGVPSGPCGGSPEHCQFG